LVCFDGGKQWQELRFKENRIKKVSVPALEKGLVFRSSICHTVRYYTGKKEAVMKPKTKELLKQINSRFYQTYAQEFAKTRNYAWESWEKLLTYIKNDDPVYVLDIGCGNGRFLEFLLENKVGVNGYTGLDESRELLSLVEQIEALGVTVDTQKVNLIDTRLTEIPLGRQEYQLIACFGLMHHIPNFEDRLAILADAATYLAENGVMITSFWQFGQFDRFAKKIIPWNSLALDQTMVDDLEPTDFLLDWQGNLTVPRYCHHFSDEEVDRYVAQLGLPVAADLRGDGKVQGYNRIVVWQKA
jgi:tRNA (uracil-5-)-methyltransferase TRM9